jgi:hypothetical protein
MNTDFRVPFIPTAEKLRHRIETMRRAFRLVHHEVCELFDQLIAQRSERRNSLGTRQASGLYFDFSGSRGEFQRF